MKFLYYLLPLFIIACANNKDNSHAVAGEEEKPPVAVSRIAEIDFQKDYRCSLPDSGNRFPERLPEEEAPIG